MKKNEVIKCPVCNAEYLPAEIYIPNEFIGNPENIKKSETGEIINYDGHSLDIVEHYQCDKCNTKFKVTAKIQFITEKDKEYDFDEEYVTELKASSLFLKED